VVLPATFVFAPAFVSLWLGAKQSGVADAIRLSILAGYITLLAAPLSSLAVGLRRHKVAAKAAALNIAVNGVSSYLLTLHFGFKGALYGSIAGAMAGSAALAIGVVRWDSRPARLVPWTSVVLAMLLAAVWLSAGPRGSGSWFHLVRDGSLYGVAGIILVTLPELRALREFVSFRRERSELPSSTPLG
jgi:O-antigen/teichoic acid export membrane protein